MKDFIKNNKKFFSMIIFGAYLLFICYYLFLSEAWGRRDLLSEYRYNFAPLTEIRRYLMNVKTIGLPRVIANLGGNIAAFIPFGIFVYYFLKEKRQPFLKSAFLGLLFTTFIEGIQLITRVGICDVDDIILNFAGVIIGALIMRANRTK